MTGGIESMYLPMTASEMKILGWDRPDVILVTGDAYIDSPHMGVAVIGRWLMAHGFRTAVIAQPDTGSDRDIGRLGEPALFWGVTAGAVDSMVSNFTALRKRRRQDDFSPGGINARPDRATIVYANLIRRFFKDTKPIVLGGIEASLRRIAHYDYWDDAVRRSILFDAKADILVYGMGERTVIELALALRNGTDWHGIRGICYASSAAQDGWIAFPSFEAVSADRGAFLHMSRLFHGHADDASPGFIQSHGKRFLVHNPPQPPLSVTELDAVGELDFTRDAHPSCRTGEIRALTTIRWAVLTHRGCFGQCHFCAIAVHQGRRVVSRTPASVLREVRRLTEGTSWKGIVSDVGGPTANMYGTSCARNWSCKRKACLFPKPCPNLSFGHQAQVALLKNIQAITGVEKVFVASGIRPDLVMADRHQGAAYIRALVRRHVSGQIKLAPEHSEPEVLSLMNKPTPESLLQFKALFDSAAAREGRRFFMTYYLMAAHPGCTDRHMAALGRFLSQSLKTTPEQLQIFTPTPSTLSTAMYHCETNLQGGRLFCEKSLSGKEKQKKRLHSRR